MIDNHQSKACSICTSNLKFSFSHKILNRYIADYYFCESCGYLKVVSPFWLNEAYSSAITSTDTGILSRNLSLLPKISSILYWVLNERGKGKYLDVAGGYGLLTRLMRDVGFDFYWSDKYCENLFARGFEYNDDVGCCNAVTAIEVLEHLTDPLSFLREVLSNTHAETIIFTTELFSGEPPSPDSWWYYAFESGQHIGFFQRKTLEKMASLLNMNFYSSNGIHIFTTKTLSKFFLYILTHKFISPFSFFLIRKFMKSNTLPDHYLVLSRF